MSVKEKMTAIADTIRRITGIQDKFSLNGMAQGVDMVYDAGYSNGVGVARSKPYIDTSMITDFKYFCYSNARTELIPLLDTSNGTNFSHMFGICKTLKSIPQLDTSNGTDFSSMFRLCSALTVIPQLDTSSGTDFNYMLYNCSALTTVPQLDTSNGTDFRSMFDGCPNLTTIPQLDISNGTKLNSMFYNCRALADVTFTGVIPLSLDIKSSPLNKSSIISVIEHLSDTASDKTLTLKKAAVNVAFGIDVDDETTYPDGSEYYILRHSKDNWTISYV